MRFLIVLVLVISGVAGLGVYRGWFQVASNIAAGKSDVTVTVDGNKMREDKDKVVDKAQGLGHEAEEKAVAAIDKSH
jgi:hypothetical protein